MLLNYILADGRTNWFEGMILIRECIPSSVYFFCLIIVQTFTFWLQSHSGFIPVRTWVVKLLQHSLSSIYRY